MKVQCKCCKKLHVNGEWTNETEIRVANVYTFCPDCYDNFLNEIPRYNSAVGFPSAHTAAS